MVVCCRVLFTDQKNRIMTGNELYEEYCNEYPLIMGYREVSYESWLQRQVLELRENVVNKNCNIPRVSNNEVAVCPRCKSKEVSVKPVTYDCYECGATWQTER